MKEKARRKNKEKSLRTSGQEYLKAFPNGPEKILQQGKVEKESGRDDAVHWRVGKGKMSHHNFHRSKYNKTQPFHSTSLFS